ncbi:MAG: hypothetical protein AMJ68_08565 [Acidithiobacillales bacterium SG8_45]|nr:MAG: hypothetical protein AMJ68_08565 [Acidithiobacillales bacterium SG8_45]
MRTVLLGRRFGSFAVLLVIATGCVRVTAAATPAVQDIVITPKYETAGIIVKSNAEKISLELKEGGRFQAAHPFVRYDQNHLASSLFGLVPDTEYKIRLGGTVERTFRTKPEFVLPPATRVVNVTDLRTLQDAVNVAEPGTTILVAPGTYQGTLTIRRSGTPGHPIVIRGDLPAIDARGHETGILIENAHHIVLDSLQVRNAEKHGVYLLRASHCVVQFLQIYDNGSWNLIISKGGERAGRHLVQYNHIADLKHGRFRFDYREQKDVTYYGIIQDNQGGWGSTIRGNLVEGHVDGISPSGDEHDLKHISESHPDILSKWVNREVDIYDNVIVEQRDDGIEADGVCVNMRIFRNRVRRAQNATTIAPVGPGPVFFVRNLLTEYNESGVKFNTAPGRGLIRNVYYYHNTFVPWEYNLEGILTLWAGTPSKNIVFRNNIFTGRLRAFSFQGVAHRPDMDYDLWLARGIKKAKRRFEKAQLPWEMHGVFADPNLSSAYVPRAGSPAIDNAVRLPGINNNYFGAGPDLGAIEYSPNT